MDILGVGGMELAAILIIMLVVAGPKRMLTWAYILGQYVAKAREAWKSVSAELQKEIDAAGLDVKVPEEIPTRQRLNATVRQHVNRATQPVTQPINETFEQARRMSQPPPRADAADPVEATPPAQRELAS